MMRIIISILFLSLLLTNFVHSSEIKELEEITLNCIKDDGSKRAVEYKIGSYNDSKTSKVTKINYRSKPQILEVIFDDFKRVRVNNSSGETYGRSGSISSFKCNFNIDSSSQKIIEINNKNLNKNESIFKVFYKFMMNNWWWLLIVFTVLYVTINSVSKKDKNKVCAWCCSSKIKLIKGREGNPYWNYRNKDGSPDKRVKGNFQLATYVSDYECPECDAITYFLHYASRNPSAKIKVWDRKLHKEGKGERKGSDMSGKKTYTKDLGENRKGKY